MCLWPFFLVFNLVKSLCLNLPIKILKLKHTGNNIYPAFEHFLQRKDKEELLKQKGVVVWFTGLSGSGKTTLAKELEKRLHQQNILVKILDGDNVRTGINQNLGFSDEERVENIRRIAEVAKLFTACGVVTICCFVSPTNDIRRMAKEIIGDKDYFEVYVKASVEVCEKRDVKGLYAKARKGEVKDFTGISAPFDVPENPDLIIQTEGEKIEESVHKIYQVVFPKIKMN
jgi:adenylylsulfate kinase